jgi:hypothetical protein
VIFGNTSKYPYAVLMKHTFNTIKTSDTLKMLSIAKIRNFDIMLTNIQVVEPPSSGLYVQELDTVVISL